MASQLAAERSAARDRARTLVKNVMGEDTLSALGMTLPDPDSNEDKNGNNGKGSPTDITNTNTALSESITALSATERKLESSLALFQKASDDEAIMKQIDRKIKMPQNIPGLSPGIWRRTINSVALCYRIKHDITPEVVCRFDKNLEIDIIFRLYQTTEFRDALRMRGVTASWLGLTDKQMMALSIVSNLSDTRPMSKKLSTVGVKGWEWEQWLTDPEFSALVRKHSEDLLVSHNPLINMALVQRAEAGDLASIKYVNELTGRWDPNSRQQIQVREFLMGVVDVLNDTLSDQPDLLRKIAGRLATLSGVTGVMNSQEITGE